MADTQIIRTDEGGVNARILAKESKADFRRVESASLKINTNLKSAQGKRLFVRYFNSVQLNVHFITTFARGKLPLEDVDHVEDLIRVKMDALEQSLNLTIDSLELLFKTNGINRYATYDTQPLVVEAAIISAIGKRFFELMHKMDETMPLFQTLDILGVITHREADNQQYRLKKTVRKFVANIRGLSNSLYRRMNEQSRRGSSEPFPNIPVTGAASTSMQPTSAATEVGENAALSVRTDDFIPSTIGETSNGNEPQPLITAIQIEDTN
jgi:hypothetical protein